jgi:hypothetical protein
VYGLTKGGGYIFTRTFGKAPENKKDIAEDFRANSA